METIVRFAKLGDGCQNKLMQDDGDNSEIITTDNCDAPILHMTSAAATYELYELKVDWEWYPVLLWDDEQQVETGVCRMKLDLL